MKFINPKIYLLWLIVVISSPAFTETPALTLATKFDVNKHPLENYLISEKLDGVRAYWDGRYLVSRGGKRFAAPQWFTQGLPLTALDGELWGGRNSFDATSGIVRRKHSHEGWRKVRFMVFELPQASGVFSERYGQMQLLEQHYGNAYWAVITQSPAPPNITILQQQLTQLETVGGEGFMLKRKQSLYRAGRSDDLLKVKLQHDAEAVVLSHHQGKGRLEGLMGSITVQMPSGIRFNIGSGFSDKQRAEPPPIGAFISYKYNGLTANGKPRFPVFWRIRNDQLLP